LVHGEDGVVVRVSGEMVVGVVGGLDEVVDDVGVGLGVVLGVG
jgi:hypothetical protein